jgi:hypothetical protein
VDYIQIIQQHVNMQAVAIAVIITQIVKYYLPTPSVLTLPVGERTTTVEAGRWWTRLLPFCPILIGMASCFGIEWDGKYTFADGVKGFMSGALAAYLYRTTKVTIFGG